MMLLDEFPPHFALLDGYDLARRRPGGRHGLPAPALAAAPLRRRRRARARPGGGASPGHERPARVEILRAALPLVRRAGRARPRCVGLDEPVAGWRGPYHNEFSTLLSFLAYPVYVWAAAAARCSCPRWTRRPSRRWATRASGCDSAAARCGPAGSASSPHEPAPRVSARRRVVVIGAGMGGLAAALRAARGGSRGPACWKRAPDPGGLAAGFEREGCTFDARPLHPARPPRPGLGLRRPGSGAGRARFTLRRAGARLRGRPPQARRPCASTPRWTRRPMGSRGVWPGSAGRYRRFVAKRDGRASTERLRAAAPALAARPRRPAANGRLAQRPVPAARAGPVLRSHRAAPAVPDALGIWTHVAGQRLEEAPSPLAFVPALVHRVGRLSTRRAASARSRGRWPPPPSARARASPTARACAASRARRPRARRDERDGGRCIEADAVVSNAGGVATYLRLLPDIPPGLRRKLLAPAPAVAGRVRLPGA